MKTKKLFCLFMTALLSVIGTSAYAQNVVIDGLYYTLNSEKRTAEVAVQSKTDVVGDIVINSTVTWEGTDYTVESTADDAFKECKQLTSIVLPNTTDYWFTITASDNWETVLYSYAGSFQTLGKQVPTDLRSAADNQSNTTRKYISNGRLFIEKNGMLYDEKGNIINR